MASRLPNHNPTSDPMTLGFLDWRGMISRRRRKWVGLGLTARMLLIVGPVVAVTTIIALTLFTITRNHELSQRRMEQAELLAASSATLLQDYILRMNTSQITPILRSIASTPPVICASLSLEGLPQSFGAPANDCADDRHAGTLMTTAVKKDGRRIGALSLRLQKEADHEQVSAAVWREAGVLVALMVVAGFLLALGLRYVVTEPVRRLAAAMRILSGGSVNFDVPDRAREDELGDVARALNVFRETKINADRTALELLDAQKELIEQAKFASLGTMVAGVAHEVNTPLGVCITAISSMSDGVQVIQKDLEGGRLTQQSLRDHLDRSKVTAELTMTNLERAAKLVRSFKAVAADQATEAPRLLRMAGYFDDVVAALRPELKKKNVTVEIQCPEHIEIVTYPSALWQIISNLVINSLLHGFADRTTGRIRLIVRYPSKGEQVAFHYEDDGVGMSAEVRAQIFEPFFTTRRADGGTGLGMTIAYNLVTQTLGGRIRCESKPAAGVRFTITFPPNEL